jgi:hypothetical protein
MRSIFTVASLLLVGPALAQSGGTPKFGPDAAPIFDNIGYLRQAPTTDYWLLANFYERQPTPNGSSAAAATMTVDALLGVPRLADEQIPGVSDLLAQVANQKWNTDIAPGGRGATFGEFTGYLRESLNAVGLERATVAVTTPADGEPAALDAFRAALAANEASAKDVMLVYFDRGVVTGAGRGGAQVALVGAYDESRDLVLIMDTDREWYVPYWTSATTLLVAMVRSTVGGPLSGERGGYFLVSRP